MSRETRYKIRQGIDGELFKTTTDPILAEIFSRQGYWVFAEAL